MNEFYNDTDHRMKHETKDYGQKMYDEHLFSTVIMLRLLVRFTVNIHNISMVDPSIHVAHVTSVLPSVSWY